MHTEALTSQNALSLISQYDVVLDCTDNAPTRYLISDACVVSHKPLVSGAAIGTDGQLTVYNYGDDGKVSVISTGNNGSSDGKVSTVFDQLGKL